MKNKTEKQKMMTKIEKHKSEMRTAVLLIRFRTTTPTSKSKKYVSYKRIASTLNLTENEVQHIGRKSLIPQNPKTP